MIFLKVLLIFVDVNKDSNKTTVEIIPALKHYPGRFTAKNLSALSNQKTFENYFLLTGNKVDDRNNHKITEILNGGRKSFVGIERDTHTVTKVIPINHNTYTNELGLNQASKTGKTKTQINQEKEKTKVKHKP